MPKRYDAMTPRPKYNEDGVWWHRVGQAHQNDKGQITIYLDSVPVPDPKKENKIVIMLFEPKERGESRSDSAASARDNKRRTEVDDDEIPF